MFCSEIMRVDNLIFISFGIQATLLLVNFVITHTRGKKVLVKNDFTFDFLVRT